MIDFFFQLLPSLFQIVDQISKQFRIFVTFVDQFLAIVAYCLDPWFMVINFISQRLKEKEDDDNNVTRLIIPS